MFVLRTRLDRPFDGDDGGVLQTDERRRAGRFAFERDRRRFMRARTILRRQLGKFLNQDPSAVPLRYGPSGKPSLETGSLRFNLSHSGELALLAFGVDRELGVDIELIQADRDLDGISRRFFSDLENGALARLQGPDRVAGFFEIWTGKEAVLKADGAGIGYPLNGFSVVAEAGGSPKLTAGRHVPFSAEDYRLHRLRVAPGFAACLAVAGSPVELRLYDHSSWREGEGESDND